jgi:proteic killer suppression protein
MLLHPWGEVIVDEWCVSAYNSEESPLRFIFRNKRLAELYYKDSGSERFPPGVVDAFFEVMAVIDAAHDERDLYALKSLHFEQLKGKPGRQGQRSIRLNDQYRLIVVLEHDGDGTYMLVIGLKKHYR